MQIDTIQKLGGFSILIGSILLLVYSISFAFILPMEQIRINPLAVYLNTNWIWISSVAFIALVLLVFGFSSVYSKMSPETGWVGFLGYIFMGLAYILQLCKVTWEIFLWPVISGNQNSLFLLRDFVIQQDHNIAIFKMLSSLTILIGVILFSAALYRSKVFPRYTALLIFIGAFIYGLGPLLSIFVAICGVFIFAAGCTILGSNMIRNAKN